jgi:hypothetical protein
MRAQQNHFASQVWKLAHDEYQELWLLLHFTRDGSPFEGHEGMMKQIELLRTELAFALERWKVLAEVEEVMEQHGLKQAFVLEDLGSWSRFSLPWFDFWTKMA